MAEAFQRQFTNDFIRVLATRNGSMHPLLRQLVTRLIQAAQRQDSCLGISSEERQLLEQQQVVGQPGDLQPLILCDDRLYLHRYFRYESEVAAMVRARNHSWQAPDDEQLKAQLDTEFGSEPGNQQKLAGLLAMLRNFLIITGGPGTGKTSTVQKILNLQLAQEPGLNVQLAAPTGKAAMRLESTINQTHPDLTVTTLHRLLGIRRDGRSWRHGPDNPISADLLIVDEASMIDLPMMHRLMQATRPDTRMILLGDPHQLPSVDTGNVLADLCQVSPGYSKAIASLADQLTQTSPRKVSVDNETHGLVDALCELTHSYRFDAKSGLGQLAGDIRTGIGAINDTPDGSVRSADSTGSTDSNLLAMMEAFWHPYFNDALALSTRLDPDISQAEQLLIRFDEARVLCSRRGGPQGVTAINGLIENHLTDIGLKMPAEAFYPGRPVLVTRNDYNLGLFNGDIGITLPLADEDAEGYLVVFPGPEPRPILASRLPEHQTCFAMTVHKAQGSEFDRVLLLLSEESSDEAISLLTRELLYTAVTRARHQITVVSPESRWSEAVNRTAARVSGMTQFLKQ